MPYCYDEEQLAVDDAMRARGTRRSKAKGVVFEDATLHAIRGYEVLIDLDGEERWIKLSSFVSMLLSPGETGEVVLKERTAIDLRLI